MTNSFYNYRDRKGIRSISWEDFHSLCKGLSGAIFPFRPELILAIGRGGFYPGTLIAHILQTELYPIRLSRRVNDRIIYQTPQWLIEPPPEVKGKRVVIVDEICDSGQTMLMVKERVEGMGAEEVRGVVLYAHSRGTAVPDYIGLITDALLINPWDREILKDGSFQFHPEYVEALAKQGVKADESLMIAPPVIKIAKG